MGLGLVLAFAGPLSTMDPLDSPIRALISGLALYGLPWAWIVWACRRADADLGRLIGRVPAGYNWLPAVGLLATTVMFSFGWSFVTRYGLSQLAPEFVESLLTSEDAVGDSIAVSVVWPILLITIIPATEEVLFRGVLLSRWGVKWGIGTGIVLTAVIFGGMNRFDAVEATVLGVVAALLYLQSRTLIVPIAFHAANWPSRDAEIPYMRNAG